MPLLCLIFFTPLEIPFLPNLQGGLHPKFDCTNLALRKGENMSWQDEVDELRRREKLAAQMGGEERIQRQHDNG